MLQQLLRTANSNDVFGNAEAVTDWARKIHSHSDLLAVYENLWSDASEEGIHYFYHR